MIELHSAQDAPNQPFGVNLLWGETPGRGGSRSGTKEGPRVSCRTNARPAHMQLVECPRDSSKAKCHRRIARTNIGIANGQACDLAGPPRRRHRRCCAFWNCSSPDNIPAGRREVQTVPWSAFRMRNR